MGIAIARSFLSLFISILVVAFMYGFFDKADESFWEPAFMLAWSILLFGIMVLINSDRLDED